jgi:hypothetical protein
MFDPVLQTAISCTAAVMQIVCADSTYKMNQHPLPKRISTNRTHLVWRGESSLTLERLPRVTQDREPFPIAIEELLI